MICRHCCHVTSSPIPFRSGQRCNLAPTLQLDLSFVCPCNSRESWSSFMSSCHQSRSHYCPLSSSFQTHSPPPGCQQEPAVSWDPTTAYPPVAKPLILHLSAWFRVLTLELSQPTYSVHARSTNSAGWTHTHLYPPALKVFSHPSGSQANSLKPHRNIRYVDKYVRDKSGRWK